MKTKKEILQWWESLGQKTENIDDLSDFYNKIDLPFEETYPLGNTSTRSIRLMTPRAKYALLLHFVNKECIRIMGF